VANFHPEAHETLEKSASPTVVWIANLKPVKRPEIFMRLAARLRDVAGAQFIIAGEAPSGPKHSRWLEEFQRAVAATPNLTFLGRQTQDQVNQLLARAWLLVNTSAYEGFPNTFIQAWQRDAVVVSLEVNPDRLLDGESIGVHAGNEDRLVQSVQRLLTDASLRASYAQRARHYVTATHSLSNADRLVELIGNCASADGVVAGALSC
jgi:glycosyltransferase involved in cell wall biosynthesis